MKARGKKLPPSYKETALPESSDDDDVPLGVKLAQKKAAIEKEGVKEAKAIRAKERAKKPTPKKAVKEESDDDAPLAKSTASKRKSNGTAAKRKPNGVKKEESDSDAPISKKAKPAAAKKGAKAESKKASESDGEEEFEWWNAPKKEDDSIKWTTLEHNGVLFPPDYEPLPKNVKMLYDGQPVNLAPEVEEVTTFWVAMMTPASSHHLDNPVFRNNFFKDFKEYCDKYGVTDAQGKKVSIKSLDKCDFSKIYDYWSQKVEQNKSKNMTKEEREAAKAKKDALEHF